MEPKKLKPKRGPEDIVQQAIIKQLRYLGWFVKETHGNIYQSGFPDLFCTHVDFGHRWVEVKLPDMKGSKFTPAQIKTFPDLCAHGSGVWVLTSDREDEINKLFQPFNWYTYLMYH